MIAREKARGLLESAGLRPHDAVVKAVAALESAADQEALVQTLAVSGLGLRTRSRDPLGELPVEKLERPNGAAFAQLVRA